MKIKKENKNKVRRYRLNDYKAQKLGCEINKSKRYRLSKQQETQLLALAPQEIKRLIFDIETSFNIVASWRIGYNLNLGHENILKERAVITIAYKWEDGSEVHVLTWDENQCDKKMLEEFSKVLNEADEAIAHNCMHVDTPVLTQDLRWVKVKDLKVGDKLAGFEEGAPPTKGFRDNGIWKGNGVEGAYRRIKSSHVTGHEIKKAPCLKVTFDNGDSITTTHDHYWLSKGIKDNTQKWKSSAELKVGYRINKYFKPWERLESYEAGWLAGFIEGEGTLKKSKGTIQGIDFCQRPTSTLDKAIDYCKQLNLPFTLNNIPKKGGLGKQDTLYAYSTGGKFETLSIIGKLDIQRFKEKIDWDNIGFLRGNDVEEATVVSIEDVGEQEIVVMSTSTKTFFGAGYGMHNCDRFDLPWLKTRFIYHRIPCRPKYKTLDTLKKVRGGFNFNSNRLDYLGQYLGVGRKLEHTGFSLWKDIVMDKSEEAMKLMCEYNIQDVLLLEDVYHVLQPYITANTHVGVHNNHAKYSCPQCGSEAVRLEKNEVSAKGAISRIMTCECCGHNYNVNNSSYKLFLETNFNSKL